MTNKNGIIIHGNEAPNCVIVKGHEAVALLDSHPMSHYNACFNALETLLKLDEGTEAIAIENATNWTPDTLKGYVAALADDRGYDYYNIVKFTAPTLTDTIETLQAEYFTWLGANSPERREDWEGADGTRSSDWVNESQVDYLRAFCRRWDVAENYVSDEEDEEEETGLEVAQAREGCIHD